MAHPGNDRTPDQYAADYVSTLQSRWNGPLGQYVRAVSPVIFPAAPPEAFVGFTTIGTQTADTGLPPVSNAFHEIGFFQVEAGPGGGPSPGARGTSNNNWARLANDGRVTALLGRDAVMGDGEWRNAIADQTVVGLWNLSDAAEAVAAGLPAQIRPTDAGSTWNVALGFTGFSAGIGGARAAIVPYAARLAQVPESGRLAAWFDVVARDGATRRLGPAGEHGNPAYDALRTWQKLAAGRALANAVGGDASWFNLGFGGDEAAAQRGLTDAAYGRSVNVAWATPGVPGTIGGGGSLLLSILTVGVVGGLLWFTLNQPKPKARALTGRRRAVAR